MILKLLTAGNATNFSSEQQALYYKRFLNSKRFSGKEVFSWLMVKGNN